MMNASTLEKEGIYQRKDDLSVNRFFLSCRSCLGVHQNLEIVSKYEREHEVESEEEDDALRNSYENMLRLVWKQLIKR